MISYVKGSLEYLCENFIIVEAGGIGYQIFVSPLTIGKMPDIGELVKIYTYMNVKEDNVSLFGFESRGELEIFNRLITVSGVGPKGALGFLALLTPAEIMIAIISDDVNTLCKAPGVGKKTAQRVILELKDKFKNSEVLEHTSNIKADIDFSGSGAKIESIEALTALGYTRSEAAKAVSEVYMENLTAEEILKLALKKMI